MKEYGKQAIELNTPVVLALGMFDGVHIGHRALLASCLSLAKELEAVAVARTFSEHPRAFFGEPLRFLTETDERAEIIASLGLLPEICVFDQRVANLMPEDYVRELAKNYLLRGVVVGENHRFGKGARGDSDLLRRMAAKMGFAIRVLSPLNYEGERVSSSRIRLAIEAAEIEKAGAMLGIPYFFRSKVASNNRIGSSIGFPTLNLDPGRKVLPRSGVYATTAQIGGSLFDASYPRFPSVTNIGLRPTVGDTKEANVETHAFSELGNCYGKAATIRLQAFLRPEEKFSSLEKLKEQIALDCRRSLEFFGSLDQAKAK